MPTPMSIEAKGLLSRTIRDLRARLLIDLEQSLRQAYKLGIDDASEAKLDAAARARRARLDRAVEDTRLRDDIVKQAAYTLLHRVVYLRLLEAAKLREIAVLTGGWQSPGYRDFRALAPDLLREDSEGYAWLLRIVFDDLALDLPGLYGRNGLTELVPIPHETLRYMIEELDRPELSSCWTDDMTLGWVYQYWNDPERKAINKKIKDDPNAKIEPHEIASKTQLFTERYMVDWLLQNSLGPLWLAICKSHGWTPLCEQHGTLARLEQRRRAWRDRRAQRAEIMPLDTDEERRWAYYVPQPIRDDTVAHAPASVRAIKLLDPAVGSGHFLIGAFELLVALYREEAWHRAELWSDVEIAESILANNLHGIDLDPRAVQIAAAGLWLKAQQLAPGARPQTMNMVASQLRLPELEEADYLGSLLNVDDLRSSQLEAFLAAHTQPSDLGLRLRGEQLAAGVRFLRMLEGQSYDLVIGNPPYQGIKSLSFSESLKSRYPKSKANLATCFVERAPQLTRPFGTFAFVTPTAWMYSKQYTSIRKELWSTWSTRLIADLGPGGFAELSGEVVTTSLNVWQASPMTDAPVTVIDGGAGRDPEAKMAELLVHGVAHAVVPERLAWVPGSPVVYRWGDAEYQWYRSAPKIVESCETRYGTITGDDARFLRFAWEVQRSRCWIRIFDRCGDHPDPTPYAEVWYPYIKGAAGKQWVEPVDHLCRWQHRGLECKVRNEARFGSFSRLIQNEDANFVQGAAFTSTGAVFGARLHHAASIIGAKGRSVYSDQIEAVVCSLNSREVSTIATILNPSLDFNIDDVVRLPMRPIVDAMVILSTVLGAFEQHERAREPSHAFVAAGPSPWAHARAWAQLAVDRPENTPLPEYIEQLTAEPNTDHISFALGVALGRFGSPESDELPDGILFLDGTLESDADGLGHPACARLRETWHTHRPEGTKRADLREYLRLDFFTEVHRKMYENRPIHWPLSSEKKTFVAWINIHRWHAGTLRSLLASHLNPTKRRLESQLADLREARRGEARRATEKQLRKLERFDAELAQFIADVSQCSERGPPGAERDAVYDPDLDDGVMINSSALWPLLLPQWKDPKKWWHSLCEAKGRKDYDWSHLAARYFPERVEEKCRRDPSMSVAHGCFWKYHPELAHEWEQRLQREIGPEFRIEDDG